jgi:hypothetical protein
MFDQVQKTEEPFQLDRLSLRDTTYEIIHGIAIALGMSLLWTLEMVRNGVFRVLDKANVRPRTRRASAFPPGRPRKLTTVDARR